MATASDVNSELWALVNKTSGTSASASDLKILAALPRALALPKTSGYGAGAIYALILSQYLFL